MATPLNIAVPKPCAQPWAAMTPTADGRHCTACATEVVDFTRLSDAEVLAYLARQGGRPVCALTYAPPLGAAPATRWRRWALAGLALLGWQPLSSCAGKPPQLPPAPVATAPTDPAAAQSQQVVVRGQVLDGASSTAVPGVRVLINDTNFGTTTDAEGKFELVMPRSWSPIAAGPLQLRFEGSPFEFVTQTVDLNVRTTPAPAALVVRLESVPDRGKVMGRIRMPEPPVAPPKS